MTNGQLRILLVGDYPDDPRLGSAKVMHELRREFTVLGHHCEAMFSPEIGGPGSRQVRQAVVPVLAARAVARKFATGAFDVVDIASAEGLWVGAMRKVGAYAHTAYVCRSHGLEHLNYRRMLDDHAVGLTSKPFPKRVWYPMSRLSQVALAARLADVLLVPNEIDWTYALSRAWQPPERIVVVPHGLSERFLGGPDAAAARRGAGVLFCGSWDHVKGIHYLVRAMDRLVERGHSIPLTVLGPGIPAADVMAAFTERARRLVTVIDRVDESRVRDEYRRHDLLVSPSTYEGFGLVVIEALSQGLPVVATPVGCAASLVRTGETGIRVPPRDADALADAVAELMDSPDKRRLLGANGAKTVAAMSWRQTARQTLDLYRKTLARIRGPQQSRASA